MANNPQTNLNALNGFNPLSYLGVNATTPPQVIIKNFAPLDTNNQFPIGTIWINELLSNIYMLVSLAGGVAEWVSVDTNLIFPLTVPQGGTGNVDFQPYTPICGGPTATAPLASVATVGTAGWVLTSQGAGMLPEFAATGASVTLTGNTGGPIVNVAGNFDVVGDAIYVTSAGTAGTITFSGIAGEYIGDAGTATQNANTVGIKGDGVNIATAGAANTLTISCSANPTFNTITTNHLATLEDVIVVDTISVNTFGAGVVTSDVTGLMTSGAPLPIAYGGTNAITAVTNGVTYFNGTSLVSTVAPTGAQVLGNAFGGIPIWVTPSFSFLNAITVTGAVDQLVLETTYYAHNYTDILIIMTGIVLSDPADQVLLQLYDSVAAAYVTTGYQAGYNYSAYNVNTLTNANATNGFLLGGVLLDTDAITVVAYLTDIQAQVSANITGQFSTFGTTTTFGTLGGGVALTNPISMIKFTTVNSGNFEDGEIQIFGIE